MNSWIWIPKTGPPTNKMNIVAYKIKQNIIPFFIAMVLLTAICCAWYFLHPSSPHFKHVPFVVRFEKVGTLSPGNRVAVRGISCGQIVKVELTDDAVFVTAEVGVDTRIPKNSQFRLITAGLMGERELNVLSGDSKEYIAAGDTVNGFYEEGAAGITRGLREILAGLREIKSDLGKTNDTVVRPMVEQAERVGDRAGRLSAKVKKNVKRLKSNLDASLQDCDAVLGKTRDELESVATKGGEFADKAKQLLPRVDSLLQKTKSIQAFTDELAAKLDADDNSAGLILAEKGELSQKLDQTAADIEALMADIKKQGLKLNVDIF